MRPLLRIKWRMLFKLGVTVVVLVAVYMYSAIKSGEYSQIETPAARPTNSIFIQGKQSNINNSNSNISNEGTQSRSKTLKRLDVNIHVNDTVTTQKIVSVNAFVPTRSKIHLAVVACGERKEETLLLLKSAIIFTSSHLMFHIFTEEHNIQSLEMQLTWWPDSIRKKYDFRLYNLSFPDDPTKKWESLFKPCASERLFLPTQLPDVDALIYVDTDVLFLRPLDDLWNLFHKFNSSQLVGLSPESEDPATGWYNRFARHPFYGELGVNSGVMLMNLTRLRHSEWMESILKFYKKYKLKITWGDQDLINIYFHYKPDQLYIYGCQWNFRPDHCMYESVCQEAEKDGISVVHGSRRVWLSAKEPAFRSVYLAFKEFDLGQDILEDLLEMINKEIVKAKHTSCGKLAKLFTRQIEKMINMTVENK